MAWTDGVDKSVGDIVTAAMWNNFFGSSGNINLTAPYLAAAAGDVFQATGSKVLARLAKGTRNQYLQTNAAANAVEWAASPASGLKWAAASGGTTPAQMEFEPMMTADTLFMNAGYAEALTANRLYISPLQPVGVSTTIGDFVCSITSSSSNFILALFSYNGSTFTKVGDDTGSTSVPSANNPAVLTGLDETMSVGTRYYYGVISDGTPSFRMKYDSVTSVNYAYYYDVGSFSIPSTVAKSAVTARYGNPVSGFFETGGLVTDS